MRQVIAMPFVWDIVYEAELSSLLTRNRVNARSVVNMTGYIVKRHSSKQPCALWKNADSISQNKVGTNEQELGDTKPSLMPHMNFGNLHRSHPPRVEMGHKLSSELMNKYSQKLKLALELQQQNFLLKNNLYFIPQDPSKRRMMLTKTSVETSLLWLDAGSWLNLRWKRQSRKRDTCCASHLHLQRLQVIANVRSSLGTQRRSLLFSWCD